MAVAEPANAGPGARLAAAREQAGWSLVQTAERLHLDVVAVKALEAGDYGSFGAPVYARGHLRRYAELVGLPAHEVEQAFHQTQSGSGMPDLRHGAGLLQKSAVGAGALRPGTAAIGAVILVVIALIWWAMRMPHGATPAPASATGRPAAHSPATDAPADPVATPRSP
jgi:cytoskeleton protein RodZ